MLYLLYLHPLAKYPGPFMGRVSSWRNVCQAWRRRQHLDLYELHEQYGEHHHGRVFKGIVEKVWALLNWEKSTPSRTRCEIWPESVVHQ